MGKNVSVTALIQQKRELEETADQLRRLCGAMQAHDDEAQVLKSAARIDGGLDFLTNGAANMLKEYADVIGQVVDQTYVTWPPEIGKGENR